MMKNTSALVSAAEVITSRSAGMLKRLLPIASRMAPSAPTPDASVGVAQPAKMLPSTSVISSAGGTKLRTTSLVVSSSPPALPARSHARRQARPHEAGDDDEDDVQAAHQQAGQDGAGEQRAHRHAHQVAHDDQHDRLGGIRMPSVPALAMVPTASALS